MTFELTDGGNNFTNTGMVKHEKIDNFYRDFL
jgi:hypothetical protein